MKKYAIIVAGGIGRRMKTNIPKQFLKISGDPVLVITINKFISFDPNIQIIVTIPEDYLEFWENIRRFYFPKFTNIFHALGGKERTDSVQSGLNLISDSEPALVAIHDSVRPFVSTEIIRESFYSAERYGSGIACVHLKDSIRKIEDDKTSKSQNREEFVLVQTPQTFRIKEIKNAYKNINPNLKHTDDASVFEAGGYSARLTAGDYKNTKITIPEDLVCSFPVSQP